MASTMVHASQRLVRGALRAAVFAAAFSAAVSASAQSARLLQKAPDAASLIAAANSAGSVRVIVQFAAPEAGSGDLSNPRAMDERRAGVAAAQDQVMGDLPPAGFDRGVTRMPVSPMMAMNVTAAELETIAANPQVVRIFRDGWRAPSLNQTLPLIGMPAAYADGGNGWGFAVAILDTGIAAGHEFFPQGKIIAEACFSTGSPGVSVSLCPNGSATQTGAGAAEAGGGACVTTNDNICAHGTHVAGIAAGLNAQHDPGEPVQGVARGAYIVAVQVFSRIDDPVVCAVFMGAPAPCVGASDSDVVAALDWVTLNVALPGNIRIASVNMSLGSGAFTAPCDGQPHKPAIDNLRDLGVVTVVASGNDGGQGSIGSPGCISTAVAVGSTDKHDVISCFTNMSYMVRLFAPGGLGGGIDQNGCGNTVGGDILSSVPFSAPLYAEFAGTSMAAPHVAGAVAAIRDACDTIPNNRKGADWIVEALVDTGIKIADTRASGAFSAPRIQVDRAITEACSVPAAVLAEEPSCELRTNNTRVKAGEQVELFWSSKGTDGGVIDNGIGSVGPNGSMILTITEDIRIKAEFTGAGGTVECATGVSQYVVGAFEPLTLVGLSALAVGGLRLRRRRS